MKNDLKTRREKYYKLNTHLAHVDNEQLNSLFGYREKTHGWGTNHTIKRWGRVIKPFYSDLEILTPLKGLLDSQSIPTSK